MKQLRRVVYRMTPQEFNYTFKDQDNMVIDLTLYTDVHFVVKHQGEVYDDVPAVAVNAPGGTVRYPAYAFPEVGIWDAQFYCLDADGNELDGEPIQFRVAPNVKDLATNELPVY